MFAVGAGVHSVGSFRHEHYQVAEKVLSDFMLRGAKDLAIKRINYLRDPSSPSVPQDDTHCTFFGDLLDLAVVLLSAFRLFYQGVRSGHG